MAIDENTDEVLLGLTQGGDEEAFVALYRRYQAKIYRFALRMSGSYSIAEDVTQEVFVSLIDHTARYEPGTGSLCAYLYGIARHQVLRRFRRERPYVSIPGEGCEPAAGSRMIAPGDPLAELDHSERIESVRQAVATLPVHYREVLVLCDLEGVSYAQAAAIVGCAEGTVRSRLNRARALLLEKLCRRGRASSGLAKVSPARCPI